MHEKELLERKGLQPADLAAAFSPHAPLVTRAIARVDALGAESKDPDTLAVLRKTAGEILLLGGHDEPALQQLAVRALSTAARAALRPRAPPHPSALAPRTHPRPRPPGRRQAALKMFRVISHCDCSSLIRQCEELIGVALERLGPRAKAAVSRFAELPPSAGAGSSS